MPNALRTAALVALACVVALLLRDDVGAWPVAFVGMMAVKR